VGLDHSLTHWSTTSVFGPRFLFFLLVGWIFFLLRFFPNRGHAGGGLSDCIFLFFQGFPCKLDCNHHILLMKYFPISQKKKEKEKRISGPFGSIY